MTPTVRRSGMATPIDEHGEFWAESPAGYNFGPHPDLPGSRIPMHTLSIHGTLETATQHATRLLRPCQPGCYCGKAM